jgi:hypothetical protein
MKVTKKFWDHNGRKYIEIDYTTLKVPWRYNRVIWVDISGTTLSLQMIEEKTEVVSLQFKTVKWEDSEYKVLTRICFK